MKNDKRDNFTYAVKNKLAKRVAIELKIENITFDYLRQKLCQCLYFSPRKYDSWTLNEYMNKMFLNTQLGKYGKYDIKNSMRTIYLLKIDEVLLEIMIIE